jgi:hypothetical protein
VKPPVPLWFLPAHALGIGRPGETYPRRPDRDIYLFRSLHLNPWSNRFRFGYVLGWDGLYWHNAVGIKGPDWEGGDWLGGGSWHRGWGPVAVCRWRRRGSLRCDIQLGRNRGCSCQHLIWRWVRGRGDVVHRALCYCVWPEGYKGDD